MSQVWISGGSLPPGQDIQSLTGNSGGAVLGDSLFNINVVGTGGTTVTGNPGTHTLTIASSGDLVWSSIIISQTAAPDNGYFVSSGALSIALPATVSSSIGDTFQIVLVGGTSWTLTQAASQQIRLGNTTTTVTTGSLASTAQGDWIELVYFGAGLWVANVRQGNITVV